MNDIDQALTAAAERVHATGLYDILRTSYPKSIVEVNAELDANWSLDGLKTWEDRMMRGINKVRKEGVI